MLNFGDYTSSNSTNSVTWTSSVSSQDMRASNTVNTVNTVNASSSNNISWKMKLCRECGHGQDEYGCFSMQGNFAVSMVFGCPCKEYVPSDNLEYLEYRYDKKLGDNK